MILNLAGDNAHPFHVLSASIAALAAILHIAFLGLFLWSGITILALLNVGSVAAHVLALFLINRNHELKGFMVIVVEVVAHAFVATYYAGWSSGFHYYFILVVPMIGLSTIRTIKVKAFFVFIAILAYLAFDVGLRQSNGISILPELANNIFYYFNTVSVMITLAFIAFGYYFLISQAEIALIKAANTDPLTQLSNRRSFMQAIDKEMVRVDKRHIELSFIICDLDHFKSINDRYGHETGDMVLRSVSHLLSNEIRQCDKLSRWGGEEFLIMLPDISRTEALMVAERLRKKVEDFKISHQGHDMNLSMTLGVTSLIDLENPEHAIARADTGLYKGKNSGRNCVVLV
jgi:diguanylate cyclase (GGDEF)-like protein